MWPLGTVHLYEPNVLKYSSYVLSAIQGLNPPQVVVPPEQALEATYTHLAQQVHFLLEVKRPVNLHTYYNLIPTAYREIADPTNFRKIIPMGIEPKTMMVINVLLSNRGYLEVAAMFSSNASAPVYYHSLVKHICSNLQEQVLVLACHGIPATHADAKSMDVIRVELNNFILAHPCEKIICTQDAAIVLLNSEHRAKTIKLPILSLEEKLGFASARMAADVKCSARDLPFLRKCPNSNHARYSVFHAAMNLRLSENEDALYFLLNYNCALFHVNELTLQITAPLLTRDLPYEVPATQPNKFLIAAMIKK